LCDVKLKGCEVDYLAASISFLGFLGLNLMCLDNIPGSSKLIKHMMESDLGQIPLLLSTSFQEKRMTSFSGS
jgi:hypothetical protein